MSQVSSSKGSDGHTLAVTDAGELYSWGDGDYGKLGHGNSSTQKSPKLVEGPLECKVHSIQSLEHWKLQSAILILCYVFILSTTPKTS